MSSRLPLVRRLAVMAGMIAVVAVVAVYQGRAIVERSRGTAFSLRRGAPVVEPLPDSQFRRSYPVVCNGAESEFAHYHSSLSAEEVIRQYAEKLHRDGAETSKAPALTATGSGSSVLSYSQDDGTVIGIIAYDGPSGCDYFAGAMPPAPEPAADGADCPGREPPGVPKPSLCTRTLSIENLGGVNSILNFYEAWGSPDGLAADVRQSMAENGWRERSESSKVLTGHFEGHALLSFERGREQCLVAVDREPKTGKIIVLMLWADRVWSQEGAAL